MSHSRKSRDPLVPPSDDPEDGVPAVVVPIEDVFDLHPYQPAELLEVLDAYLEAALERGFTEVRVIHGRGRGVARARVQTFLGDDPRVQSFEEAAPGRGGWGATLARIGDPARAPTTGQPVFVGDIQGCGEEFGALLSRAANEFGSDYTLYVAGDAVNRGYDNLHVLERIREHVDAGRGELVLGNHELTLIRVALGISTKDSQHTFDDVLGSTTCGEWVEWLRRRPLVVSGLLGERSFVMVHASVHPKWDFAQVQREARRVERHLSSDEAERVEALLASPLERARRGTPRDVLGRLTCARSVRAPRHRWSSHPPTDIGEEAWHEAWRRQKHDYGVVYGHWAMQGLHVARGLRGLDTGCVHHTSDSEGRLTAWVPRLRGRSNKDPFRTARTPSSDSGRTDTELWHEPARHVRRPARD